MKLRGHHLICLHFFRGKGYDKEFIKNLSNLLKNIKYKEITITSSADDVCRKCPYSKGNLCKYKEDAEQEIREMDRTALKLLNINQKTIKWKEIKKKIPSIFTEWFAYCKTCNWEDDCKKNKEWIKLVRGSK